MTNSKHLRTSTKFVRLAINLSGMATLKPHFKKSKKQSSKLKVNFNRAVTASIPKLAVCKFCISECFTPICWNRTGRLRTPQRDLNSQKHLQILEIIFFHSPRLLPISLKPASDSAFAPSPPNTLLCFHPPHIPIHNKVLFQYFPESSICLIFFLGGYFIFYISYIRSNECIQGKNSILPSQSPATSGYHLNSEGLCLGKVCLYPSANGSSFLCFRTYTGRLAQVL